MEVLKVKIDFEKPGSGSRHESPIIKRDFKPKTVKGQSSYIQEQKNKLDS